MDDAKPTEHDMAIATETLRAMEIARYRDQISRLTTALAERDAECERLREIVSHLPKTADGVPIMQEALCPLRNSNEAWREIAETAIEGWRQSGIPGRHVETWAAIVRRAESERLAAEAAKESPHA